MITKIKHLNFYAILILIFFPNDVQSQQTIHLMLGFHEILYFLHQNTNINNFQCISYYILICKYCKIDIPNISFQVFYYFYSNR